MHLRMVECFVPFAGHCDLDLWPSFYKNRIRSISLILLKVGIPNLVCGCNFGWRSVTYHFWATLNLTFDLVCRIIVSRTYLLNYLRWESQICSMDTSLDVDVSHTILGHCDLDLWPNFVSYIIWCRNPKFGLLIPLGMAEWCKPFWITFTLTLTSVLISRCFVSGAHLLFYSQLSSNLSYAWPIPLGAFVMWLWHFMS